MKSTSDEMWNLIEKVYIKGYDDGLFDGTQSAFKSLDLVTDALTRKESNGVSTVSVPSHKTR
jgi:hypothetical protein